MNLIWVRLGGVAYLCSLQHQLRWSSWGWGIFFQDHTTRGKPVDPDFGWGCWLGFWCLSMWASLRGHLGFLPAGHAGFKSNIPRDRRWEVPISSEAGIVWVPLYSFGQVVTDPT